MVGSINPVSFNNYNFLQRGVSPSILSASMLATWLVIPLREMRCQHTDTEVL